MWLLKTEAENHEREKKVKKEQKEIQRQIGQVKNATVELSPNGRLEKHDWHCRTYKSKSHGVMNLQLESKDTR